jgi:dihydrofolate reductase/thymidylate synthase
MKKFNIIYASDNKNGIWKNNDLAWRISEDLKYFKKNTTDSEDWKTNAIIMWKNTWESIPKKFKPLPLRVNCILSRSYNFEEIIWDIRKFNTFEWALQNLSLDESIDKIFVIGWAYLYNKVFSNPNLETIYKTKVIWDFNCDVFVDDIPDNFKLKESSKIKKENDIEFIFEVYKRVA